MKNTTKPVRLAKIDDLVVSLVLTANNTPEFKDNPAEINAALALCEITVSLPFGWFTDAEKTLVLMIVTELGLNWEEFVESVRDGSVSYYAQASETSFRETGIRVMPLQDIVKECLRRHLAEFGKVNFPI
jgi:hypothetical protein